jgi:energy-coupling factor transporter ATP-binding protein EcfA2
VRITTLRTFLVPPRWCFLRIDTDDGISGWGEPVVEGRAATVARAVEELGDYLIGRDPAPIEDHWQVLTKGGFYRGGPILSSAVAGIDTALWDIAGKVAGRPIHGLLGGPVRDRVRAYGWIGGDRPSEVAASAKEAIARGFDAVKMNGSAELGPIATPGATGDVVARLEGAIVERGAFRLGPIDLEIGWADRVALTGPNGSGKTTLLRALLGELPLAAGRRSVGSGVVFGELDQARERFTGDDRILAAFGQLPVPEARSLLAKFGLGADDLARPAATLSPGERTRAALALVVASRVNCLVLDEPTNHLDLPAIEELEAALGRYAGSVVLVTHDRRFLESFQATRTVGLAL